MDFSPLISAHRVHVHILGIAGSFMAGLARIAQECGHRVTGSDAAPRPPMSVQLEQAGIPVTEGNGAEQLDEAPDCIIVGNVQTRGMPVVERMLELRMRYESGPQWLHDQVLRGRRVLAVAGTHGKTTTCAMVDHILRCAGSEPGCLIGGVPHDTGHSARLGAGEWFVVEADEYDSAFFDKRSKFVHYAPELLVLNNLEFDHADIFEDLAAIEQQFHHLVRTVPGDGRILCRAGDPALERVLRRGCWTPVETFGDSVDCDWRACVRPGHPLEVEHAGERSSASGFHPFGTHNALNATAAVAAAFHAGVPPQDALEALASFGGVARRLSRVADLGDGGALYDDFAHHPTEIHASIQAVRERHPHSRVLAIVDPASNSMRMGVHRAQLAEVLSGADIAWVATAEDLSWVGSSWEGAGRCHLVQAGEIPVQVADAACPGDVVLVMSNRSGSELHRHIGKLLRDVRDT